VFRHLPPRPHLLLFTRERKLSKKLFSGLSLQQLEEFLPGCDLPVNAILDIVIFLSFLIQLLLSFSRKGIMLLGPPGTGKSFAVKSVQYHCRQYCEVSIHNLNIPELLSEPNPVEIFKLRMKEMEKGKKHIEF
jgi:DNA replication protein DnaC